MTAASIRSRVRTEMIDEIKAAARRHLAVDGANLSMRAVARDMGMVSSALYRYFPGRDDLLTALIIDAYDALGAAVEQADAAVARTDLRGRWLAACGAVRDWALANPPEYALIYGSPVPGYKAPQDTIGPASRTGIALIAILADGVASGRLRADPEDLQPAGVHADMALLVAATFPGLPESLLLRGLTASIHLFGVVSFELFGQLNNVVRDESGFFKHQMDQMATLIGL
jgi:AcrR family transcriptional regulator